MTSTYFNMTDHTGLSGFLPTVTFTGTGAFTKAMRIDQLATIGITGFYEADFVDTITTIGQDGDLSGAFQNDTKVVVVTINKVTSIKASAFSGCTALRSITLDTAINTTGSFPANPNYKRYLLTSIGNSAFYGCTSLRNLHIPDTVRIIPDSLCQGCTGLEVAVMGYGWNRSGDTYITDASINQYAFAGCTNLRFFIIPETVGTVGDYAFNNCTSLSYVAILGKPTFGFTVFTGSMGSGARYVYDTTQTGLTIPSGATTNPYTEYTFQASDGVTLTAANVLSRFNGITPTPTWVKVKIIGNLTTIGTAAFRPYEITNAHYSRIIGVSYPSTVTTFQYGIFESYNSPTYGVCNIAAHYIPNTVTTTTTGSNQNSYTFNMSSIANGELSQTRQAVFLSGPNKIILGNNAFLYSSIRAVILYDAAVAPNYIPANCFAYAQYLQLVNFFQKNAYSTIPYIFNNGFDATFISGKVGPGRHYIYIPKNLGYFGLNTFANINSNILFTLHDKPVDGPAGTGTEGLGSNVAGNGHYLHQGSGNYMAISNAYAIVHFICNWYDANGTLQGSNKGYGFPYHVLFHPSITTITNRFYDGANTNSIIKSMAIHHSATPTVVLNTSAFDLCTQLSHAYLNKRVKTIGVNAFRNAKLSGAFDLIDASPALEGIYWAAFYTDTNYTSDLSQVTIPSSVKALGGYIFGNGTTGKKPYFKSLSFATDISFWGDYDTTIGASTTITNFGLSDTNHARYMAIPAYFCQNCDYLQNVSFFDTVDANSIDIQANASGALERADNNLPITTRYNKQILTNQIKRIGVQAFYRNQRLQSIRIPEGVTTIDYQAFYDAYSLTYLYLPDTLNTMDINSGAFHYMNYRYNKFGYTGIGRQVSIRIPPLFIDYVRVDTGSAATGTFNTGQVSDGLQSNSEAATYFFTVTYKSSSNKVSSNVLGRFTNQAVAPFIQYHVVTDGITGILGGSTTNARAFDGYTNLRTVTIADTVTNIGDAAFYNCTGLISVFISTTSQLVNIGVQAFRDCTALTSFFIPNSLHRISFDMFHSCIKLASITYGDNPGIISIDQGAFYNTGRALTSIFIPASVVNIGRYAFNANGGSASRNILNTVTIGAGSRLKAIGGFAFGNGGGDIYNSAAYLHNLVLPSTLRYMGGNTADNGRIFQNAFISNHTDHFIFPSSVTFLPYACFYADTTTTDISNVYVPMSITAIAGPRIHNGYRDNTNNRVAGIGGYIFSTSRAGSLIYLPSHLSGVDSPADEASATNKVPFPDATRARSYYRPVSYSTNPLTSLNLLSTLGTTTSETATNQIHASISEGVTIIGNGTNSITTGGNAANLISVNIPSSVTTIRDHAFKGSSALVYVTFSENSHLTSIGASSFQDCSMIHDIRLPDTLTSIGQNAFSGCRNLTSISIPYNVTSLGSGAFYSLPIFISLGSTLTGPSTSSRFGYSVSLSSDGSTVAGGAYSFDNNRGLVRVYKFNRSTSTWTIVGTDLLGTTNSQFGYSVSLSSDGTTLAVGAPFYMNSQALYRGLVQVYKFNGTTWTIVGNGTFYSTGISLFGYSVSLSSDGSTVACGDPWYSGYKGLVQVYKFNGSTWTIVGTNLSRTPSSNFGTSVSLSSDGTTVAVGAYFYNSQQGLVQVYKFNGTTWTIVGSPNGTDLSGTTNSQFGRSVSLSSDGSTVACGAPYYDSFSGLVQVYKFNGTTWTIVGNGTDLYGTTSSRFGYSVSLSSDGSTVAGGAYEGNSATGLVQVFNRRSDLKSVQMHQRLYNTISSSLSSYFTSPVSINFQIIPSLMLTNTLNPSKLTLSQINNLYIRYRQSQLGFCSRITVAASNADGILRADDITTALAGTTGFVHLDISTNVTSIGANACNTNQQIYSVAIPKTVQTIGTYAFYYCRNLSYLSFHPDSVCTNIAVGAFENNNIIDLTLPDSLTTIGQSAFQTSNILTSVCIPKSVTSTTFDNGPFLGCPKLTSVVLPSSLSSLGTGTYFSTSGSTTTGISFTSYPTTSDIPHFKLSDFSLPSGIVQNVIDSAVSYIDHRAYYYYPDITLYAVNSTYQQTITSGPASYQVNNIKMPIMPATFMMNGRSWQNCSLIPIYRSVPDLNVYSDVYGTVTAAMDNLDDGFLLMPGYSLCVFTNLYDEENISVFDVALANIAEPYTTAVEKSTYIDNQFGKVPINVSGSTYFGINNATSSVLIMFNGKILGKMFAG